jgi:hypothetical protein
MRWRLAVGLAALWCGGWITESVQAQSTPWPCPIRPIEPCFTHHGRLSSQNGIALKIWLIGTSRVVGLDNDVEELPDTLRKYLDMSSPNHSYIYGDFEICPTQADTPGQMRRVCVAGAKNLVVENLSGLQPPFRILSTWKNTRR